MNEIRTIEQLQQALCLEGIDSVSDLEKAFGRIARALLNGFCIRKENERYRFVEIEFYHTLADRAEGREGITYKRGRTEPGDFFFHPSGVDLCFRSDEQSYGGILIRSIMLEGGDGKTEGEFINGPGKVADRLFDKFSAIQTPKNFPRLDTTEPAVRITPQAFPRWNIDKKFGSVRAYRYTWPWENWKPQKYAASPWDYKGNLKKK